MSVPSYTPLQITITNKPVTPYQGKRRVWGDFECPECGKTWSSGNSWANMGQKCQRCLVNVYPYAQRRLEASSSENDPNKPHLSNLCEKCKILGYNCRGRKY